MPHLTAQAYVDAPDNRRSSAACQALLRGASLIQMTKPRRTLLAMALVTRTYMTDDLDGSEGDVSTVHIALDNTSYEIDLGAANQARLRETLAKYLDAATEVKTKPVTRRGKKSAPVASCPTGQGTDSGNS